MMMLSIPSCPIPDGALLAHYIREGTYTDCFMTDIRGSVSLEQYVLAFYTTRVFKLERLILKIVASRPATDDQAQQLAAGSIDTFAAWYEEARNETQLLMSDFRHRTRSWLMVVPMAGDSTMHTRLYFGSAIVPVKNPVTGRPGLGPGFRALLGFHRLYSKVLLYTARSRLEANDE